MPGLDLLLTNFLQPIMLAFLLGTLAGAVKSELELPEANPGIYLTSSLRVTLPFNLLLGLPLYYQYAKWLTA